MSKREYTPAKPREHVCPICGQKFLGHGSKIYCSDEWELYCGLTGDYIGHWDDKSLNNGHRPDVCPLVEVPTPHGRLIDGDNVIDLLREQLTGDRDTVYEYYDDGLEMAISELSIVPTIIETEEGEGHEQN